MSDDIPASTKATEAVDLFSSTTVLAVLYTFSVMLYYLCARLSYRQARNLDGRIKKRTVFTFGLTSVMIICATMDVVLINRYMQLVYIEYSHLPGGPLGVQAQLHTVKTAMIDLIIALIEEIVATGVLVSSTNLVGITLMFSSLTPGMASLGCLEWNSLFSTHHYSVCSALSGLYR